MAIVTIRRGTKSGGEALAECLAKRLGYPTLGREVAQQAAAELGVPPEDLGAMLEDRPGRFEGVSVLRNVYVGAVQAALADAAAEGNLVYHGLAGGLLLRDAPGVLRVHLIAPMEMRVRSLMDSHGMREADAESYIRDLDDSRARWVSFYFGVDLNDPGLYDMVLNLESFFIPEACEVIAAAAERPEFEFTAERKAEFDDFRLSTRVRVALLDDLGVQSLELKPKAQRGRVVVHGQAPVMNRDEVGDRIVEIARSVPGVDDVELSIDWSDAYP